MKTWGWGLLGVLALACFSATAEAKSGVVAGVVIDVKGRPVIVDKDRADKLKGLKGDERRRIGRKLKNGKMVYEGDVIITGGQDKAAIAFVGGAEVRINSNSEFVLENGGGRKPTSVFTRFGNAFTRMLHGKAGMQVRTPLAVAAVRGTEADVDMSDRLDVKVYEGHVDVENAYGKTKLTEGMMASVSGAGTAPSAATTMKKEDYKIWQGDLNPQNIEKRLNKLMDAAGQKRKVCITSNRGGAAKTICLDVEK